MHPQVIESQLLLGFAGGLPADETAYELFRMNSSLGIIAPSLVRDICEFLGKDLARCIEESLKKGRDGKLAELRAPGEPASANWYELYAQRFEKPNGEIEGWIIKLANITARKFAEEFGIVLATGDMPVAHIVTDAQKEDAPVLAWNPECVRMFGYTTGEAVGRPLAELIRKDQQLVNRIRKITDSGRVWEGRISYEGKNGMGGECGSFVRRWHNRRHGLHIDIRKFEKPRPKKAWLGDAVLLKMKNPSLRDAEIARIVGIDPAQVSREEFYQQLKGIVEENERRNREQTKGFKNSKTGEFEAWEEQ